MTDETVRPRFPKTVIVAVVVAFALTALNLLAAVHQLSLVFSAIVPAAAGIFLLRKQVWSGYGFALFQLAQAMIVPLVVIRSPGVPKIQIALLMGLALVLAALFYSAGRSLAATGARREPVWPWVAFICVFILPLIFVQAFMVPTGAMEDTLLVGDRILARTFPRVRPGFGELIVFRYPVDRRQTFIKRVIGMPGDRIKISSQIVERNGTPLKESYVVHKFGGTNYGDNFPGSAPQAMMQGDPAGTAAVMDMLEHHVSNGQVVVPPGKYFVLGDSRDNSLDSRYWGFVDASDIVGTPILIYDSKESMGTPKTRWRRIFKLL